MKVQGNNKQGQGNDNYNHKPEDMRHDQDRLL